MINTLSKTNVPKIRIIKKQTIAAPQDFMFEKIDENTVRLQFGASSLEFHNDGAICFKNNHASLSLAANGQIKIDGVAIDQHSQKNITLDAKQHIYLNSK